jgi:fatty-acyl-CoA synthase
VKGIGYWLKKRQILSPHKEAVVQGGRRLTYNQLNQRVNQLAHSLMAQGLEKGDRVAVLSMNCLEFLEIIMATAKLGLILVPLNWRLTAPELGFMLKDSETRFMFFDPDLESLAQGVTEKADLDRLVVLGSKNLLGAETYDALLSGQPTDEPQVESSMEDPHIIMYTAGTTGKPKGAILSQNASYYNALNLQVALDFTSTDRDLLILPMFHIGGIGLFTLPMLYVGATVVIERTFDAARTLRLLKEENITLCFGVPAIFLMLAQEPGFAQSRLSELKVLMSGGAPLPVSLVKEYQKKGITLQQGFGMSEAAPSIATLEKSLALRKAGSIGKAVFHLEVEIRDENDNPLPPGEVGELVMRGPNVMQGYWNRPDATNEALKGGWFHSGDLARMDGEGDLYIVDRKKDMFISGGENVYPAEVENAIFEIPQVAEAAVIGVPDQRWGEVGLAAVALKKGQDLEAAELTSLLSEKLAKYKIPKQVVFVDALPRNAAGKVLKNALRQDYA